MATTPQSVPSGIVTTVAPQPSPARPSPMASGAEWFRKMKPYCNAVEITVALRRSPPPAGVEGTGFNAACHALAGQVDEARRAIDVLESGQRYRAAGIVFDVGHPIADSGDDRSAGPIMELVIDYWPNHYMALYHAGAAEYMLGQRDLARKNLEAFLQAYHANDGWRSNGLEMLRRLSDSTAAMRDARRPREP